MSRKPRPDATLHHLPLDQQKELCEWLLGGMSYRAARAQLKEDYSVSTSTGALHDFYHSFCSPELLRRRAAAVSTSEEVVAEAKAAPGRWTDATIERLGQMSFEMSLNPAVSAKDVKSLFGMVLKARDQDAADEERALEREKFEEAKRKAKAHDEAKEEMAKLRDPSAGLSDSERQAIIDKVDEILGLKS